ncbi:Cytochrome P450 [Lecanosticta acicola]|uniref:Cytochrome P450 n=1 Tax=Lecanosticta acicola TaxID=111012 RepID=A0AAI8Z3N7_9PEZI|nr:Cytochrome P450 [Lecanosticta acicola]
MAFLLAGNAPIVLALSLIGYMVSRIIYDLFFHPLSKFPGPKLNAISELPGIIALLKGRLALENKKLHDRYGSVVRVSPNELAFNSVQAWEDIYGHRPGHANFHKDPIHVGSVEAVPGVTTLTMADDENHARQRRALSHAFSQKALLEQEYIVKSYVDQLIDHMKRMVENDEAFNLVNWLNFTTFDIIGDLAFGEPFGCLTDGHFNDWVSLIFETVKAGAIEQATRRFAEAGSLTQDTLLKLIPARVRGYRTQHLRRSREKCLKRLEASNNKHRDFIYHILKQQEKHDLKQDEVIVNSALFIVAGSETTANALSGLLARLIYNPDKYEKLTDEIRAAFTLESDISYAALSELSYLNACIEEGLRIHPPVPQGLLRTVPKDGDTIDGHWVAGGTSVAVGGWAASHNPENFKDCDSFIPERWLDKEYDSDKKKAMQPFSLGPRGCIGRHLSYMEMRLILGRLLWNFDVVSVDGAWQWNPEGEMRNMRAFTTWEKVSVIPNGSSHRLLTALSLISTSK